MNEPKLKLKPKVQEIIGDSLDDAAHEVIQITDTDLANKFIINNDNAINNPQAVFTNIESYEQEINAIGLQKIDEKLRLRVLKQVSAQRFKMRQLRVENYQKQKFLTVSKKIKSFFIRDKSAYHTLFDPHFESSDWKVYQRTKAKRNRENEIHRNDLLAYTDLKLRDRKTLIHSWVTELIFAFIFLTLALTFISIVTVKTTAYNLVAETILINSLNHIYRSILAFSILSIVTLIIPYFFLFTSWFVGINDVHKSRNYHYFMTIFLVITAILSLTALGLFISYFSLSWAQWIPS